MVDCWFLYKQYIWCNNRTGSIYLVGWFWYLRNCRRCRIKSWNKYWI